MLVASHGASGWLTVQDGAIALTPAGRLLADRVALSFAQSV